MSFIHPSYLSCFIDSVCFGFERSGEPYDRSQLSAVISQEAGKPIPIDLDLISEIASDYIKECVKRGPIAHSCHAISCAFVNTLTDIMSSVPCAITIGDVWVRGEKKYGVTRQKIDQLIRNGFDKSKFVDAHVWITFSDMTVFDLTLLHTLRADEGHSPDVFSESEFLIWRETEPSDYIYEPLLVDNNFFDKVERGLFQN